MTSPWSLLTTRGKAFALIGAVVVAAGIVLGYPDITRIGLVLVALPVLALVLMPRRTPKMRVLREVDPVRLTPDERGTVDVRFTNVSGRTTPIYLAEEHLDYRLGDRPRFVLPRMVHGEEKRLRYAVRSRHRGAFQLGPVVLRQRDPFGLTFLSLQLSSRSEVLVLPRLHALGGRRVRGTSRGSEGEMPQMVALHGEDDVSIRSYRDGDELRRVHWPATAHRGELMVRQEDRPARRRALLLLDSRDSAHPGTGTRASYEWAVSAIASVARHLVSEGFVVHLLTDASLRDGTADHQIDLDAVLSALARVQPEEDSRLDRLAAAAASFTAGGVLVVAAVVADDEDALRNLAAIRQPGSRAMAFVLDPVKFGGTARRSGGRDVQAPTTTLADSGWQTVVVGPHTEIPAAWVSVSEVTGVAGWSP
ncbi:DUF58 domain-containing protein [Ornithinimicrobium cerasi]|uniref:Uncharacterized conserved protein, DUF58 family, contains vWF domain n=1 Tax=Ornithinimicrobium cerasi TaxID=2248773 RepID=A0A285VD37_9MICO|nr:DUF58 domain-containing protein [Ornithinimicrobium cerasi]SOC51994.1 Uncharacterized conserved protein, DUF58 family, contains vWF domain [Ornithinimicrobium cerasi]